jgi:hypothetical protein
MVCARPKDATKGLSKGALKRLILIGKEERSLISLLRETAEASGILKKSCTLANTP